MFALPASTRLCLWVTAAWSGTLGVDEAVVRALPDVDDISGAVGRFTVWGEFGEQILACALPRPGAPGLLPRGPDEMREAAMEYGECVFVPGLGGVVVPVVSEYGTAGDLGVGVEFLPFDADPVPQHRLTGIDVGFAERELRAALGASTAALEELDLGATELRRPAVARPSENWALPDGLPPRAARLIELSGTILSAVEVAQEHTGDLVGGRGGAVAVQLQTLEAAATTALEHATNSAALRIAGLIPAE